jgi:hypothetical protein
MPFSFAQVVEVASELANHVNIAIGVPEQLQLAHLFELYKQVCVVAWLYQQEA